MDTIIIIGVSMMYALIACRVYRVMRQIDAQLNRKEHRLNLLLAAAWPFSVVVIGAIVILTGDPGVFGVNYKPEE